MEKPLPEEVLKEIKNNSEKEVTPEKTEQENREIEENNETLKNVIAVLENAGTDALKTAIEKE